MEYRVNGKNLEDIAETQFGTDERYAASFGTSKYLYAGKTYEDGHTDKFIDYRAGYSYSEEVGIKNKYLANGTGQYAIARKGTRPAFNTLINITSPGSWYLNKFDDGELWLSAYNGSRSGTKLGWVQSDRRVIFAGFCGGGGGGGGGNGTSSGGGGGGAGYRYVCVRIINNVTYKFTVGGAGQGGGVGTNGSSGSVSKLALTREGVTLEWTANGGSFGFGGSNAGKGGDGGVTDTGSRNPGSYAHGAFVYSVKNITGGKGGDRHCNGSGVTANFYNYTPEKQRIFFPSTGGGDAGTPSGGGGGGGCAHGSGGNGGSAYEEGHEAYKQGSGGGGGVFVLFSGRAGGDGGKGSLTIYY